MFAVLARVKKLENQRHQIRTHVFTYIDCRHRPDPFKPLSLSLIQSSFLQLHHVPCCNCKTFNSLTTLALFKLQTNACMISQINMLSLFFFLSSSFLILFFFRKTSALHILNQWFLSFENRLHLHQSFKIPRYNLHSQENSLYRKILTYLDSLPSVEDSDYTNLFSGPNPSDIWVKSYFGLIFLRVSLFYYERLDVLRDTSRHLSQMLLSFQFAQSFCV